MIPNSIINILSRGKINMNHLQNVNTPDELAQQLLNSGMVSQNDVNKAKQMWNQPNVRQMINSKFQY